MQERRSLGESLCKERGSSSGAETPGRSLSLSEAVAQPCLLEGVVKVVVVG